MSKVHRLTLYYFLFHLLSSCFCHYYPVEGNSNKTLIPGPLLKRDWAMGTRLGPSERVRLQKSHCRCSATNERLLVRGILSI